MNFRQIEAKQVAESMVINLLNKKRENLISTMKIS